MFDCFLIQPVTPAHYQTIGDLVRTLIANGHWFRLAYGPDNELSFTCKSGKAGDAFCAACRCVNLPWVEDRVDQIEEPLQITEKPAADRTVTNG